MKSSLQRGTAMYSGRKYDVSKEVWSLLVRFMEQKLGATHQSEEVDRVVLFFSNHGGSWVGLNRGVVMAVHFRNHEPHTMIVHEFNMYIPDRYIPSYYSLVIVGLCWMALIFIKIDKYWYYEYPVFASAQ
jgi:hypothetical protein